MQNNPRYLIGDRDDYAHQVDDGRGLFSSHIQIPYSDEGTLELDILYALCEYKQYALFEHISRSPGFC